jgi:hypothetical protein
MNNNLFFIQNEDVKGKTEIWNVYSKHSNDYLGKIKWHSGWRRYVLDIISDTFWSQECLSEVIVKIISLEDKRKSRIRLNLESDEDELSSKQEGKI